MVKHLFSNILALTKGKDSMFEKQSNLDGCKLTAGQEAPRLPSFVLLRHCLGTAPGVHSITERRGTARQTKSVCVDESSKHSAYSKHCSFRPG